MDGLLRAQVAALRLRLRTAVKSTEASRVHRPQRLQHVRSAGAASSFSAAVPPRPSSATAAAFAGTGVAAPFYQWN